MEPSYRNVVLPKRTRFASMVFITMTIVIAPLSDVSAKDSNGGVTPRVHAVCIFDVDNTLTHAANANEKICRSAIFDNSPPPAWPVNGGTNNWVKLAIKTCIEKGYDIAIATAESGSEAGTGGALNPVQKTFIKSLAPKTFTDAFFKTPAFQTSCGVVKSSVNGTRWCIANEYGRKEAMYIKILNYYNIVPTQWQYSIMFDDELKNLTAANQVGLKTVQSSPNCAGSYCDKGCGIMQGAIQAIVDRPALVDIAVP